MERMELTGIEVVNPNVIERARAGNKVRLLSNSFVGVGETVSVKNELYRVVEKGQILFTLNPQKGKISINQREAETVQNFPRLSKEYCVDSHKNQLLEKMGFKDEKEFVNFVISSKMHNPYFDVLVLYYADVVKML